MTKIKSAIAKAHGRTKGGYLHVSNDSGDLLHSHNTEVNPNFFWVHFIVFEIFFLPNGYLTITIIKKNLNITLLYLHFWN